MSNWISVNCIDPSDIRVSEDKKGQLSAGVIFPTEFGCFQAQSETLNLSVMQTTGENTVSCLSCLSSVNFKLIFNNCSNNINYYISPQSLQSSLPNLNSVYSATIDDIEGCFTFSGVTNSDVNLSTISTLTEFKDCIECQSQGGFSVSFEQEILINNKYDLNNIDILSKSGDFLEPFTYYISDQNNVKNVTISKETSLIVGDSIGTLGIMLVDSNNFSATTTTEVLRRVSFNTNKGDIVNDVNYQNFKQGVQDNYNLLIQNRINPQSQDQTK